jgi:hypothetical protein
MARIGIWIIGARGGLATTLIAGTDLMAAGRAPRTGLVTDLPPFSGAGLFEVGDVVFGGHDIRDGDVHLSALEIAKSNGLDSRRRLGGRCGGSRRPKPTSDRVLRSAGVPQSKPSSVAP